MTRLLLLGCALALAAPQQPTATYWPAARLRELSGRLAARLTAQKVATENLGRFGNHQVMMTHREADGEAEIHENQVDIFIVQNGQATVVTGGELEGSRVVGPGEIRGTSIRGGRKRTAGPGDVVHIPAGTPHQVLVPPGGRFTYLIIKVNAP